MSYANNHRPVAHTSTGVAYHATDVYGMGVYLEVYFVKGRHTKADIQPTLRELYQHHNVYRLQIKWTRHENSINRC